jgi:hypothetical protein
MSDTPFSSDAEGAPLDMESVKITLSLAWLVERSNGVIGKSGTGKIFLARRYPAVGLTKKAPANACIS